MHACWCIRARMCHARGAFRREQANQRLKQFPSPKNGTQTNRQAVTPWGAPHARRSSTMPCGKKERGRLSIFTGTPRAGTVLKKEDVNLECRGRPSNQILREREQWKPAVKERILPHGHKTRTTSVTPKPHWPTPRCSNRRPKNMQGPLGACGAGEEPRLPLGRPCGGG